MVCDFIMCIMPIFNHLKKGNIRHVQLGKLVIRFLCKQYQVFGCHVEFFVIDIYKYISQIYDANLIMPRVNPMPVFILTWP
jgi:hypothetical protein